MIATIKEELRQDEYNSFIDDLTERLYKIGTKSFLEQGDLSDFDADFSLNDARELITESPLEVIDMLMDMLAN